MSIKPPSGYTVPFFMGYTTKHGGHLPDLPEAHACWYYYVLARRQYEEIEQGFTIQYEHADRSHSVNYKQLADTICHCYGVRLFEMIRMWQYVDAQACLLGLPLLPEGERYRFNTPYEITHRAILTTH